MSENIYADSAAKATPSRTFFGRVMGYFALAVGAAGAGVFASLLLMPPELLFSPVFLWGTWIVTFGMFWFARVWSDKSYGYLVLLLLAVLMGSATTPLIWMAAAIGGVAMVGKALFATTAMYLGLALYGLTTKRDLAGMAGFLIAGTIGLFVVTLASGLLALAGVQIWGSTMEMVVSGFGILLFAGWTTYDFQKIVKEQPAGITPVYAATVLFINFVMLFRYILHFMLAFSGRD